MHNTGREQRQEQWRCRKCRKTKSNRTVTNKETWGNTTEVDFTANYYRKTDLLHTVS